MTATSPPIGKAYAPRTYAVGREKIREFALAVGERDPLHSDVVAARAAGHADLVAPPMFAVVYALPALVEAMQDPELAIDYGRLVHGAQAFTWGPLVIAGEEITTQGSVQDVATRGGLQFFTFATRSVNEREEVVCQGTWTNIVR